MARNRKNDLTPEEIALIKAQIAAIPAQTAQAAADTAAKQRMAFDQLQAEQAMNAEKTGLGREEITGRNQQAQLAAAIGLLDTSAKERIARNAEQGNIASDLAKRTDISQSVAARALAESGQPGLYNALQEEDARKREATISQMVPALQSAKSDADRVKNFKPALEALGPGTYDVALARAFPNEANASVRGPIQAKRFEGTTAAPTGGGADYSGLIGTLLNKSGVTPTVTDGSPGVGNRSATGAVDQGLGFAPNGFPNLPNTPETSYTGIGHGSLEGSKIVPGGIQTPSGGFIGGTLGADRLAKLITPRGGDMASTVSAINASRQGDVTSAANANVNGPTSSDEIPSVPALPSAIAAAAPQVAQGGTTVPYDQLIQNQPAAVPAGAPTPQVVAPAPVVAGDLTQSAHPQMDAAISHFFNQLVPNQMEYLKQQQQQRKNELALQ